MRHKHRDEAINCHGAGRKRGEGAIPSGATLLYPKAEHEKEGMRDGKEVVNVFREVKEVGL